jgi:hypothetical protein
MNPIVEHAMEVDMNPILEQAADAPPPPDGPPPMVKAKARSSQVFMMSRGTVNWDSAADRRHLERNQQGCYRKHSTTICMATFLMGGGLVMQRRARLAMPAALH